MSQCMDRSDIHLFTEHLFEASEVAGSATYKQSLCIHFIQSIKQREIGSLVCSGIKKVNEQTVNSSDMNNFSVQIIN